MRDTFVLIFLLLNIQIAFAENLYENALGHFISEIIEEQESAREESYKDSIYHHILCFEDNNSIKKVSYILNGYEIVRINDVKLYLDTCKSNIATIFIMGNLEYNEAHENPFQIDFCEYKIELREKDLVFYNMSNHVMSYRYDCDTKRFKYLHCISGIISSYESQKLAKQKGWY